MAEKNTNHMNAVIFNIQRFSLQDGPGIRTTVFFKGCPLRCTWCANPESQASLPQVAHSDALCNKCGDCVSACPKQAVTLIESGICIERALCDNCAKCLERCTRGALRLYGEEISLEAVLEVVKRDVAFYRNTGGGVTASGGEPLIQSKFVSELFRACKTLGIHTCLDTCGHSPSESLHQVLEYTDLVYYDLKLIDQVRHQAATGASNELIAQNLQDIAKQCKAFVIRVPLVPGINTTDEDIQAIADVVVGLPSGLTPEVDLLPYHRFGGSKYRMLDRDYLLLQLETLKATDIEVQRAKEIFDRAGLSCRVVA